MNFGAFLLMPSPSVRPHAEIYARGLDIAQAAEALGYDGVWLAEHHFSNYGYLSQPLIMATHLAAKTSRIRIGTAVVVLPLHNPLMVAEQAATIDLLSEGRFDLGLGRGYQQYEFQRLGLDLKDSRGRWEEAMRSPRSPSATRANTTASRRPTYCQNPTRNPTPRSGWWARAPSP